MPNSSSRLLVQYGCGLCAPREWRNFDCSPTLRLQRLPAVGGLFRRFSKPRFPENVEYGDIVKGLPVAKHTADCIYCSHVLEHLSLEDLRTALKNTKMCLVPQGIFRLAVPDLRQLAADYVADSSSDAAHVFMRDSCLGQTTRERGLIGFLRSALGNSRHLWMWDYESLWQELSTAGFEQIRRAYYNDSREPAFLAVEDRSRWVNNLGIECIA